MSGTREYSIRDIPPGLRQIVLRDEALVSEDSLAVDVVGETVMQRLPGAPAFEPVETRQCMRTETLQLSGTHKTEENGEIDIHLSKFVQCIHTAIPRPGEERYI